MGKANRLSKRPDWKVRVENDNSNQVFIKDCWLYSLHKVVIEGPEINIVEKIKKARSKDEKIVRVVEEIKRAEVKMLQEEEQQIKGNLILKEGKVYVLKKEELRAEIIQLHYSTPVAGYGRKQKITELVIRNYQWLGVMKDIRKYVEGYDIC